MADLTVLTRQALEEVARSTDLAAFEQTRIRWLGKKGTLTERLKSLGALSAAERPAAGALINEAKERLQAAIEARRETLGREEIERRLGAGRIAVTLPGRGAELGGLHPVTEARMRSEARFRRAGFDVASGSELEDDSLNFGSLNFTPDH